MTLTLRPHQTKAVKAMLRNTKTNHHSYCGGKTMCMIDDAMNEFSRTVSSQTIVVVAPRILLANQLSSEFLYHNLDGDYNITVNVMHVHSGETHHFSTTKVDEIRQFNYQTACDEKHLLIFTTYHSLHKIQESNIVVDTIYFDEAHNSVQKNFFPATEHFSHFAERCYYFTATPNIVVRLSRRV